MSSAPWLRASSSRVISKPFRGCAARTFISSRSSVPRSSIGSAILQNLRGESQWNLRVGGRKSRDWAPSLDEGIHWPCPARREEAAGADMCFVGVERQGAADAAAALRAVSVTDEASGLLNFNGVLILLIDVHALD